MGSLDDIAPYCADGEHGFCTKTWCDCACHPAGKGHEFVDYMMGVAARLQEAEARLREAVEEFQRVEVHFRERMDEFQRQLDELFNRIREQVHKN